MNNTNKKQSKKIKSPVFVWETKIIRKGKKTLGSKFCGVVSHKRNVPFWCVRGDILTQDEL